MGTSNTSQAGENDTEGQTLSVDEDGRFTSGDIEHGAYRLDISGEPFVPYSIGVDLAPGGSVVIPDITLRLMTRCDYNTKPPRGLPLTRRDR